MELSAVEKDFEEVGIETADVEDEEKDNCFIQIQLNKFRFDQSYKSLK